MTNTAPEINSFALKFIYPVSFGFKEAIIINSRPIFRTTDIRIYLFSCQVDTRASIILIALSVFIHWQKRFISNFSVFVSGNAHLFVHNLHRLLPILLNLKRLLLNLINVDRLWNVFGILSSIHRRLYCSLALWFFYFFGNLNLCSLVIRTGHSSFNSSEVSWGLGLGRAGLETWAPTTQKLGYNIRAHLVCELWCLHKAVLVCCHV